MALKLYLNHEDDNLSDQYADVSNVGTVVTRSISAGLPEILGPHGLQAILMADPTGYTSASTGQMRVATDPGGTPFFAVGCRPLLRDFVL